jgi:L-seryl-tRNA(Ser) seleniumtransferase
VNERLRQLPSVDELAGSIDMRYPRHLVVAEARRVIDGARDRLKAGQPVDIPNLPDDLLRAIDSLELPSLRPVINATGVVLHTNLGRAPLPAVNVPAGYSNLEYDLSTGSRGKRDVHVTPVLERLLGQPSIVVNNNAAAVYLVLNELAAGKEVIVSRGELIEIGDGFRIPDIMARSGVAVREVGTTNRTNTEDYRAAITERTALILRVHPSNFHITGFTSRPERQQLVALAHEQGIPVYEDLGSGCLVDLREYGISEPTVMDSIASGIDIVSFSGDKLLGGPQAGVIAGRADLVARIRRNPMFRALRVDKIIYGALEATLRHLFFRRWDNIPALRMIRMTLEETRARCEAVRDKLNVPCSVVRSESVIGGGSTPDQKIPSYVLAIADADVPELERRLRAGDPPVIARIADGALIIHLRTVLESEDDALVSALNGSRRVPDTSLPKCSL